MRKEAGEPLGAEVASAVFDRVRTCDNHCDFCFIHQLPPGMRRSLSLKDDDYRLSFLYGNFTTLTRFTEMDLERVVTERLSPLFVSIHATDPDVRAGLLRNRAGATSLRWLSALLDAGIEVHGQVVVCPGRTTGPSWRTPWPGSSTATPGWPRWPAYRSGVSRFSTEDTMRPHTVAGGGLRAATPSTLAAHLPRGRGPAGGLRRRRVLPDGRPALPGRATYEGFPQHENGIGMARAFEAAFGGRRVLGHGRPPRVLRLGRRRPGRRLPGPAADPAPRPRGGAPGRRPHRRVRGPGPRAPGGLAGSDDIRVIPVENRYFGGTIGVSGLMTGTDLTRVLAGQPDGHRYLLPDACLSEGRFLDDLRGRPPPARRGGGHRRAVAAPGPGRRPARRRRRVPVTLGASR